MIQVKTLCGWIVQVLARPALIPNVMGCSVDNTLRKQYCHITIQIDALSVCKQGVATLLLPLP